MPSTAKNSAISTSFTEDHKIEMPPRVEIHTRGLIGQKEALQRKAFVFPTVEIVPRKAAIL